VFCGQISSQRRNHRRHLIIQHNCRPDGTQATAVEIEQVRSWKPSQTTGRSVMYKSCEFVDSDSDDDTTLIESGASTPSERSPSPTRSSRPKRARSESSGSPSLPRDTRRVVSQRPATSSPTASRPATPPRPAPPVRKQVRRVRFKQEETAATQGETSTAAQQSVKQPPEKAKRPTTATGKDKKAKAEEHLATEVETRQTPIATTTAKELLVSTPRLDAMTEIAR